jgi:hypothetical protein
VAEYAKLSKEELKNELDTVMSGKDFTEASARIAQKDKAVEESINKINSKIEVWQARQQEEMVRRQLDAKKFAENSAKKTTSLADTEVDSGKVPKRRELKTDSLARVGLYNFGANVPSADRERNKLLKDIKIALEKPSMKLA